MTAVFYIIIAIVVAVISFQARARATTTTTTTTKRWTKERHNPQFVLYEWNCTFLLLIDVFYSILFMIFCCLFSFFAFPSFAFFVAFSAGSSSSGVPQNAHYDIVVVVVLIPQLVHPAITHPKALSGFWAILHNETVKTTEVWKWIKN